MKVWKICRFFIFLLLRSTLGEDTVAEDIGVHQLERLVELLTSKECEDLLFALSHPEENIFQHLERLSPGKKQLNVKPRAKRDTSSAADSEAQCRTALTDWLLRYGKQTYYDRLSRALQHIGRTDIAIEVGKNINQDKALSLKRFVEGYHKYVNSLNFPPVKLETEDHQKEDQRVRKRQVRDLTWRDLDLIVERAPVPLYQKGPLDVALPLLYGILLGFGGTLLAGISILLIIIRISRRNQHSRHPRVTSSSCSKLMAGDVMLEDAASARSEAAQ
ncbi:transmembrane and death domain protein 1-like isoform X1 [Dicentrarchus labrax]|uniref:transmembrane and death domain protein 1-like isoform X1 n=1 Tax=Dicentrarchus labrax TaxID=13489 RepID=UPI0021F4FEC9|nr:transmembrane and death domain protein 1-like isoform X1 [Dicentrarchus labrax]